MWLSFCECQVQKRGRGVADGGPKPGPFHDERVNCPLAQRTSHRLILPVGRAVGSPLVRQAGMARQVTVDWLLGPMVGQPGRHGRCRLLGPLIAGCRWGHTGQYGGAQRREARVAFPELVVHVLLAILRLWLPSPMGSAAWRIRPASDFFPKKCRAKKGS